MEDESTATQASDTGHAASGGKGSSGRTIAVNPQSDSTEPGRDAGARTDMLASEYATILGQLAEGVIVTDCAGRIVFVNQAAADIHGMARLDIDPQAYSDTYHLFTEDGRPYPPLELPLARAVRGETIVDARWRIRRPDATEVRAIGSAQPLRGPDGAAIGAVLTLRDDTQRNKSEEELAESRAFIRLLLDSSADAFYSIDREGTTTLCNVTFLRMLGFAAEADVIGKKLHDVIHHSHPDGSHYAKEDCPIYLAAQTGKPAHVTDEWFFRADGSAFPVEYRVHPIWRNGRIDGAVCTFLDITERRRTEAALRANEARLRLALDAAQLGSWELDVATDTSVRTLRHDQVFGYDERVEHWGYQAFIGHVLAEDRERVGAAFRAAAQTGSAWDVECRIRRAGDGALRWIEVHGCPEHAPDGTVARLYGIVSDITDRKQAEENLRRLNLALEGQVDDRTRERDRIWNLSRDPFLIADAEGRWLSVSPAWTELLGWSESDLLGRTSEWMEHPDDRAKASAETARLAAGATTTRFENRFRAANGDYHWFAWTAVHEAGLLYGVARDITVEKEAAAELERAQEALRQAQKMEAVGQLTGGVAHDFNNLLQIVIGNLDILHRNLPAESGRLRRAADNAMTGARRAAVLTQRLLAFSRRQPLAPKPIDVNALVSGMSELLGRTLGETVAIETVLAGGLWRAEVDPNQLENAILNLAINARDAMPDGGKLTIETQNAHLDHSYVARNVETAVGQYVLICVSDTGIGIDSATLARVFEPFFSTKEVGKGTGLGLSQVYGFVKQSGGHVKLYSEPGEGTTVKLYLPRYTGAAAEAEPAKEQPVPEGSAGGTVLVAEDDDHVRAFSVEVLRELGYRVLEAPDGPFALRLLEREQGRVDLLFTDVVLPNGISGAQLARQAAELRPGLKILFTTGYARNAIVHHGRLDAGVELITKPFTYADLAARVRAILDPGPDRS